MLLEQSLCLPFLRFLHIQPAPAYFFCKSGSLLMLDWKITNKGGGWGRGLEWISQPGRRWERTNVSEESSEA